MPELTFSNPNLAVLAYAEVDGETGAATRLNSGIEARKLPGIVGSYLIFMPTRLGSFTETDFVIVQAKNNDDGSGIVAKMDTVYNAQFKAIQFFSGAVFGGTTPPVEGTSINSSFFILILRASIAALGTSPLPP